MIPVRTMQLPAVSVACAAALCAATWLAWNIVRPKPDADRATAFSWNHNIPKIDEKPAQTKLDVPASARTVTLCDELFPESTPPAAQIAKPRPILRIDLIAVTTDPAPRVFVLDQTSGEYLRLSLGDSCSCGAVLTAVTDTAATFQIAEHETTVELSR